jgi:hypothetical protein
MASECKAPEDAKIFTTMVKQILGEVNVLMRRLAALEQRCQELEEKHETAMRNIHGVINVMSDQSLRDSTK